VWPNISGIHKNECTKVQTTYRKVHIQTTYLKVHIQATYPKVHIIPSSQVQYIKTSPGDAPVTRKSMSREEDQNDGGLPFYIKEHGRKPKDFK
jgi:hypothetical protein